MTGGKFERLLTPDEAAEIVKVSAKTIREWLKAGTLKGIKTGRLWRIKESELRAFAYGPPQEK